MVGTDAMPAVSSASLRIQRTSYEEPASACLCAAAVGLLVVIDLDSLHRFRARPRENSDYHQVARGARPLPEGPHPSGERADGRRARGDEAGAGARSAVRV